MTDVIIFAGTTEGRVLCEILSAKGVNVLMCVATDYALQLINKNEHLEISAKRLNQEQIQALITERGSKLVVDTTHPYAKEVTENIKTACDNLAIEYIRVVRESEKFNRNNVIYFDSTESVVEYLSENSQTVLLTTGSKKLELFTKVKDFEHRIFARVLPFTEVVEKCTSLGFKGRQLICMQGPFSHQFNIALIKMLNVDCLVTKDSGDTGGFYEKLSAAEETGIKLVVIGRPETEQGHSLGQAKEIVLNRFNKKETKTESSRFPIFIPINNENVVIVGGGKIAERRAKVMLEFDPNLTIIAPEASENLKELAHNNKLKLQLKEYQKEDILSAKLVITATNNRHVNKQVADDCKSENILVSVADKKEESSFYFPGIIVEGGLVTGVISTDGNHGKVKRAMIKLRENGKEDKR